MTLNLSNHNEIDSITFNKFLTSNLSRKRAI
jgi:hypothetical protein